MLVAASAIFWKVSKNELRTRMVLLKKNKKGRTFILDEAL